MAADQDLAFGHELHLHKLWISKLKPEYFDLKVRVEDLVCSKITNIIKTMKEQRGKEEKLFRPLLI